MGFSIINHPFWGTPIYENPHMTVKIDDLGYPWPYVRKPPFYTIFYGLYEKKPSLNGRCSWQGWAHSRPRPGSWTLHRFHPRTWSWKQPSFTAPHGLSLRSDNDLEQKSEMIMKHFIMKNKRWWFGKNPSKKMIMLTMQIWSERFEMMIIQLAMLAENP